MEFCVDPHWNKMREAVKSRGMEALVPDTVENVINGMSRQLEGEDSVDTFNPLMHMFWAIINNMPASPIFLLSLDGCPMCYLNEELAKHVLVCKNPECRVKPGDTCEWMIDRAADDALNHWKELTK